MSEKPFSDEAQTLMLETVDYALKKFTAGDPFSLLMLAGYKDGTTRSAIFKLPTVDESVIEAEKFLHKELAGAERYIVIFVQDRESDRPALVGWVEEVGMDSAVQIGVRLSIHEIDGERKLKWPDKVDIVGTPSIKWFD